MENSISFRQTIHMLSLLSLIPSLLCMVMSSHKCVWKPCYIDVYVHGRCFSILFLFIKTFLSFLSLWFMAFLIILRLSYHIIIPFTAYIVILIHPEVSPFFLIDVYQPYTAINWEHCTLLEPQLYTFFFYNIFINIFKHNKQ